MIRDHHRRCATAALVVAIVSGVASPAPLRAAPDDPAAAPPPGSALPAATTTETTTATATNATNATNAAQPGPVEPLPAERTPLPLLQERFVGVASRAIRFDWRSRTAMVGVVANELIERNNFASVRAGVLGRKAFGDLILEGAVVWADSFATSGSEIIALTPYRQAGRPARAELEVNVAYALAEGVTTAMPWFLPPAELVLHAVAGARYLLYPQLFVGRPADLPADLTTAASIVSPVLSDDDVRVLERSAAPGMAIDRSRLQVLVGLATDVYFAPGIFVSPRALIAPPLVGAFTQTSLGWWWELGLVGGVAW